MRYQDLEPYWKRVYELEWEAVKEGSKAIAALIFSETGEVISEGRNRIASEAKNPRVLHAEVEAVRNLDIAKYYNVKAYTLLTALEPCPMCLGTLVMGGIRNVIIGAKDALGGAMDLLNHSAYLQNKHVKVTWMDQQYGDVQRGMQTLKEIYYSQDEEKLQRIFADFSVYNKRGVDAAKQLFKEGWFTKKTPKDYNIDEIFDALMERIERNS